MNRLQIVYQPMVTVYSGWWIFGSEFTFYCEKVFTDAWDAAQYNGVFLKQLEAKGVKLKIGRFAPATQQLELSELTDVESRGDEIQVK